jgi:hypothetical protein
MERDLRSGSVTTDIVPAELTGQGEETELATRPNEELALALISPATPYSLQRLRMSAAMIGAQGNKPETIAFLAKRERSEPIVRHIAQCGSQAEPNNPFWKKLLALLPQTPAPAIDVLPHLTRFVAMTGLTRAGKGNRMQWIRPTRTLTP